MSEQDQEVSVDGSSSGFIKTEEVEEIVQNTTDIALRGVSAELEGITRNTEKKALEAARQEIQREVSTVKKEFFVIFGIFSSFTAFIVGEINIFKSIDPIWNKVGFSFILVALMMGFLFGVMYLSDEKYEKKKREFKSIFLWFFCIGIICMLLGKVDFLIHVIRIF